MNQVSESKLHASHDAADFELPLIERVRQILPRIAELSASAEEQRAVPLESMELLRQAGFLRALQPRKYGGLEVTLQEYGPCVVEIAQACIPTAWSSSLLAQHSHAVALLSREVQDEIWGGDGDVLVSSSVAPLGKYVDVDGGIRLSGKFGWSSGCDHATWAMVGFLRPRNTGDEPSIHFALLPLGDYAILDDWHTAGLRGTGSKSLLVEDAFVPAHRIVSVESMNMGESAGFGVHSGAIFNAAFVPYFSVGFSAVAIGAAKSVARAYKEKVSGRLHAYTRAKVSANAPASMRLAESTHQIEAATAFIEKDWKSITDRSLSGELPSIDDLVTWRANQTYVTKMALEAADRLFIASGGSAWMLSNELQKLWRDTRMIGGHAWSDYDVAAQVYGRHLMGLEPDPGLI